MPAQPSWHMLSPIPAQFRAANPRPGALPLSCPHAAILKQHRSRPPPIRYKSRHEHPYQTGHPARLHGLHRSQPCGLWSVHPLNPLPIPTSLPPRRQSMAFVFDETSCGRLTPPTSPQATASTPATSSHATHAANAVSLNGQPRNYPLPTPARTHLSKAFLLLPSPKPPPPPQNPSENSPPRHSEKN